MSGKDDSSKQVYNTPCYQLIRQLTMLILMIITMVISLSIETFQSIMNNKMDEIIKYNCSKT